MTSAFGSAPSRAPTAGDAARRSLLTLFVVCTGQFVVILDTSVVNIALPAIQADLGFSASGLQWVVNAYVLLFGGLLLLGGRAADLFGRRRMFLVGMGLFTAASLLVGLATSPAMAIAARALQGVGGAIVTPTTLAILVTEFPEGPARNKALAIWSAVGAGGAAFGLIIGGVLTDLLSWEWVFFINIPVGAVAILAGRSILRESVGEEREGFDVPGAMIATGGLVLLVFGIVKAEAFGWTDARTVAAVLGGAALLMLFTWVERRVRHPVVKLDIFRHRAVATANVAMMLVGAAMLTSFYFMSLYLQEVKGWSPLRCGFAILPVPIAVTTGAVITQQTMHRAGVRTTLICGLILCASGTALLIGLSPDSAYLSGVLVPLALFGLGASGTLVSLTLAATAGIEPSAQGVASAVFNTAQQVGGALGLAILSTIVAEHLAAGPTTPDRASDAYAYAFAGDVAFLLVALGLVIARMPRIRPESPVAGSHAPGGEVAAVPAGATT